MYYEKNQLIAQAIETYGEESLTLKGGIEVTVPIIPQKTGRGRASKELLTTIAVLNTERQNRIEEGMKMVENHIKNTARTAAIEEYQNQVARSRKQKMYNITFIGIICFMLMIDIVATSINFHNLSFFMRETFSSIIYFVFAFYLSFANFIFAFLGNKAMVWKTSALLPIDFVVSFLTTIENGLNMNMVFIGLYAILIFGVTVSLCNSFFKSEYKHIIFGEEE